jgi:hypothetical protein
VGGVGCGGGGGGGCKRRGKGSRGSEGLEAPLESAGKGSRAERACRVSHGHASGSQAPPRAAAAAGCLA